MIKTITLLLAGASLLPATWLAATAQSLDPSFAPGTYYAPARAYSALEQADGKRVLLGNFTRASGTAASYLVRYTAGGAVDAAFQQNLGTTSQIYRAAQLASGQLLLTGFANTPLVAGGITRNGLLRLNADGTADASFNPGAGPASAVGAAYNGIDYALPLPNGQFLVGGLFDQFNGVDRKNLVRLNADGSVDTSFNANLASNDEVTYVAVLPNGKYLIGGSVNNSPALVHGLARLNADGSRDATFNANLQPYADASYFLVQPDGKLLVAGYITAADNGAAPTKGLVRLLPDGSPDNTFTTPADLTDAGLYSGYGKPLELLPDGKILVLLSSNNRGQRNSLIRLNADGTPDNSFQAGAGANALVNSFTRLTSGDILAAGDFVNFSGALDRPVVQLTSAGAIDPAFAPVLQVSGSASSLVRQADGKILVGGGFSEINGQPVRRLARLTTAGVLDASFTPTASDFDYSVGDMALQPDGRLLLTADNSVQRLLASGARDNSFVAPNLAGSNLSRLLLQPDGRVLISGNFGYLDGGALATPLLRLLANGSRDASFAPATTGAGRFVSVFNLALQPDGKVLVAGNFTPATGSTTIRTVARLESTGALDASFANTTFTTAAPTLGLTTLAIQPDGKVLVGGSFTAVAGTPRVGLTRLNADGTPDAGFVAPFTSGSVSTLLVQPNGRILVGGTVRGTNVPTNLARLLSSGALDTSFGATAVPNGGVFGLLAQPDGNLLLAGSFTTIGGQPSGGVARLTSTSVLSVQAPQAVADRTTAWPVPAHTTLTVAPDASAHAQALDVLDVLGRAVRHQALSSGAPATLTVEGLPAGTYLLRVSYAEGLVTRRIQVQ